MTDRRQADDIVRIHGPDALCIADAVPMTPPVQDPDPPKLGCNDRDNGARLAHWYGRKMRYAGNRWYLWNDVVFEPDETNARRNFAEQAVRRIAREAEALEARAKQTGGEAAEQLLDRAKVLRAWMAKSLHTPRIDRMLKEGASLDPIAIREAQLDTHPHLIAVRNGVVDLKTGKLLPPDPRLLLTQQVRLPFDPHARAPRWEALIHQVLGEDEELISWFHRVCGYAITGHVSEHVLVVLKGEGANGKSTVMGALQRVLGPFAATCPPDLLMRRKFSGHPTELADLRSRRLVVSHEVVLGAEFNEARVKQLTGGDPVKARGMRQDFSEFLPTHKLFICVNDLPDIVANDHGTWRRMRVVPFDVTISEEDRDKDLSRKLEAEALGILAWLVRGAVLWHAHGLGKCSRVDEAVDAYRADANPVQRFLRDHTETSTEHRHAAQRLHDVYKAWCKRCEEVPLSYRNFNNAVRRLGFDAEHTRAGLTWKGLQAVSVAD